MMNKKILIRKDSGSETDFLNELQYTITKGNELILLFHESQPFFTIDNILSFVELLTDPVKFFDDVLTANVKHDDRLSVNPERLAELYDIPRAEYLTGVVKCLSVAQFEAYADFITFQSGQLQTDDSKVEAHKDSFNIYATSDKAIKLVNYYTKLTAQLNESIEVQGLGSNSINELAKIFDLLILENKLIVNDIKLSEKIKYL